MRENRFRWFGHAMKKKNSEAVRMVMKLNVEGRRGRRKKK